MLRDPAAEPGRQVHLPPPVPRLKRHMLKLSQAASEPALKRLLVPDDPDASGRRGIGCPRKLNLTAVRGQNVIKCVQVRVPPVLLTWGGGPIFQ